MPNNSIRINLSKEDIISDIRMMLGADFLREESMLIVEGEDDLTFFTGKLSPKVYMYESFSGKQGVKEIVERFTDNRVIGIQDRDYQVSPDHTFIHFYDYNCLEMMIVSDDSAFENFCNSYYQGQYTPLDLRRIIMQDLAPLSAYRKLNDHNNWEINFNGVNFGNLCHPSTGRLDYTLLEDRIKQINPSRVAEIPVHMQAAHILSTSLTSLGDLLSVTRGHDFLHYFHRMCEHSNIRHIRLPKANELGRPLLCTYRLSDFRGSTLYHEITTEQANHNRTVFKL